MIESDYIKALEKRIEQLELAMKSVHSGADKPLWEIVLNYPDLYNGNSQMTVEFLKLTLISGSDYLKKICVNIIDLLINSEEYDLVYV